MEEQRTLSRAERHIINSALMDVVWSVVGETVDQGESGAASDSFVPEASTVVRR